MGFKTKLDCEGVLWHVIATELTISSEDIYVSDEEEQVSQTVTTSQKIQNSVKSKPATVQHSPSTFTEEKKME